MYIYTNGWICGGIDVQLDGWMDEWFNRQICGYKIRRERGIHMQIDRWLMYTDRLMNGYTFTHTRHVDRCNDGFICGWMKELINIHYRQID